MAERMEKDLWRLDIPLAGNPLKNLNSYLITGERSLLIDTGFRQEPCREAMERQLAEIGVDRDRMDIYLTHLHSDHTGLAPDLIRPGCKIYIGAVDGRRLTDQALDEGWRGLSQAYVREGFSQEEMAVLWDTNPAKVSAPPAWDGYTLLEDGGCLRYGDHDLRCVLAPGHTPGHMCLYDPDRRWFFSGDHVLFHITPNICRWEGVADSLGDYLQSLDKVGGLPVERLLPAHREETGDLGLRAAELAVHHAGRIQDAWDAVDREPGRCAYEIAGGMAWSIRARSWAEFPLTQKFFAVGEALAHLDYLEARGRVARREEGGRFVYFSLPGGGA